MKPDIHADIDQDTQQGVCLHPRLGPTRGGIKVRVITDLPQGHPWWVLNFIVEED